MYTVICLGKKACDIGESFEHIENYVVKLIDVNIDGENCFSIAQQASPELYELNTPDLSLFFNNVTDDIIFITSGDSETLSCSLKILQQIKHKNIHICYIRPNIDFLTKKNILQDKLAFNVLQEYTRSGLFKNIFIYSDNSIENILSDVSIAEYDKRYNELVRNSLTNFFKLNDTESVIDNTHTPNDLTRIISFGYYELNNNIESLFYPIINCEYKIYNFFINENVLKTDKTLHKTIKNKIKNKNSTYEKNSYSIRSITSEQSFCYVVAYSKFIQQ